MKKSFIPLLIIFLAIFSSCGNTKTLMKTKETVRKTNGRKKTFVAMLKDNNIVVLRYSKRLGIRRDHSKTVNSFGEVYDFYDKTMFEYLSNKDKYNIDSIRIISNRVATKMQAQYNKYKNSVVDESTINPDEKIVLKFNSETLNYEFVYCKNENAKDTLIILKNGKIETLRSSGKINQFISNILELILRHAELNLPQIKYYSNVNRIEIDGKNIILDTNSLAKIYEIIKSCDDSRLKWLDKDNKISQPKAQLINTKSPNTEPVQKNNILSICVGASNQVPVAAMIKACHSENTSVATISTFGLIQGIAQGTANISYILYDTGATNTTTVNVMVKVMALPTTISNASLYIRNTTTLTNFVSGKFTSSSPCIAHIASVAEFPCLNEANGIVTGLEVGTSIVT